MMVSSFMGEELCTDLREKNPAVCLAGGWFLKRTKNAIENQEYLGAGRIYFRDPLILSSLRLLKSYPKSYFPKSHGNSLNGD